MSEVNFGKTITLKQASNLIRTNPDTRFLLRGEPGIGKSSLLESISSALGYDYAYIDVPNLDLGDIAMPVIDHDTKTTRYYPNARFKLHERKPIVIMLDEYTKGADPVKNMLHPMFEKANPRLGDISLHEDNIVFLTGNLSTDGVGDSLKAHSMNRLVSVTIAKPDADAVIAALTGAIGESGARDMQAYIEFSDQLPTWEATIKDPKNTKIPTSAGACAIVVFGAISRVEKDTIDSFMEYLERFDAEWQAVFAINIAKSQAKQAIAFSAKAFTAWVAKNQDLL